jgi:glycosyltransferase 2 family protein
MNKIIQVLVLTTIGVYLLYGFRLDDIDIDKFSLFWIFITFVTMIAGNFALSIRWARMSALSFKISFETIIVSNALNMILPARLGELSKAVYLKKFYGYNYNKTFAVLFVERFFDLIALFGLLCIWAYFYFVDDTVRYAIVGLSVLFIVIIVFFLNRRVLLLLKKIPFKRVRIYSQKIYKSINTLFSSPLYIFLYTLAVWFVYFMTAFVFYKYGMDFKLNLHEVVELFLFSTIAIALPLSPAGIGTYEGAVVLFLSYHGVAKADGLVAAMAYHALLFGMDFLLLYIFLMVKNIKMKELVK